MAAARLVLLIILVCAVWHCAVGTPSRDVAALQKLLRLWQGTPVVLDSWSLNEDADPCSSRWKGVVCSQTQSVINLHLNNANLSGGIPTAIGALDELIILDLSGNPMLTSTIPRQLGHLRRLTHLKLSGCNFFGKVPPELYNLDKLEYLDLSRNPRLSLDLDAEELISLRRQQSPTFSRHRLLNHRRRLLQAPSSNRQVLPIYYTYIALGAVGLVLVIISAFCLCRWMSLRKTRSDLYLMTPGPPVAATTFQQRRIYANEADSS